MADDAVQGVLFVPTTHGLRPAPALMPEGTSSVPKDTLPISSPSPIPSPGDAIEFSDETYRRIKNELGMQRRRVLDFVERCGLRGATADEFARAYDVGINRISGRFSELAAKGMIQRSTSEKSRPTRTGQQAAVWVSVGISEL